MRDLTLLIRASGTVTKTIFGREELCGLDIHGGMLNCKDFVPGVPKGLSSFYYWVSLWLFVRLDGESALNCIQNILKEFPRQLLRMEENVVLGRW